MGALTRREIDDGLALLLTLAYVVDNPKQRVEEDGGN